MHKEAGWQLVELGTDCLALLTDASRYHENSETDELLLGMYTRFTRVSAAVLTAGPALGLMLSSNIAKLPTMTTPGVRYSVFQQDSCRHAY